MNTRNSFRDISGVFDSDHFKSGFSRQANGILRVQVLTKMPGVTPAMVRWWFTDYMQTTEHYNMWYPKAHIWMDWENKRPGELVGASHLVHEYLGDELYKLRIQFVEPQEILGELPPHSDRFIVAAKAGSLEQPINVTTMGHIVNATEDGSEMRSVFWMGDVSKRRGNKDVKSIVSVLANTRIIRKLLIKDQFAEDLMDHCRVEMAILAGFLPELYQKHSV